ncbi:polynucleotide adenylyltransferase PcnB [Jeongeupia naejangsanensis]|uniref:Poly(A) polymerase I n=1 Tax=Jeongeupia naejangsanensis TaxID=613195 RepID=A0ABS2BNS3_9NEIS|nr:polynucleotide adenylyltransferase PcnB [Jeongeupia naejangsanensis]MBM3117279.1 polynucleotide adenylyltransferase PcnB [Jeongeupia naejangsanensis]
MIRKLIGKVLRRPGKRVLHAKHYGIRRDQLHSGALKVCDRLQAAGYDAYIVGGAVRDLMLGKHPKDFDVATSATPEQVRHVFNRSRIIGRRFKIVHVPFYDRDGEEIIEVTTFRSAAEAPTDDAGRILRDNVYGTIEEDASRRDFTVNALYYDPNREEILDFHHGVDDLERRQLVMIGDPAQRYREDPVRMLRAVRLAAKLELTIAPATKKPIATLTSLLENIPSARLFDETMKLLLSGKAWACVSALRAEGLHRSLLPILERQLDDPNAATFIQRALENTDSRLADDKPVSAGFLFATLLWHDVEQLWKKKEAAGEHTMPALVAAMNEVDDRVSKRLAIPNRYGAAMKEVWLMQPRFEQRAGQRPFRLLEQPRFRAAYDFLVLRAQCGLADKALAEWWQQFQYCDDATRSSLIANVAGSDKSGPQRKRKPRRKKPAAAPASGA